MILHFYLKYRTEFGQRIFIVSGNLPYGNNAGEVHIPMQYANEEYWQTSIELPDDFDEPVNYYYVVENSDGLRIFDGEENRFLDLSVKKKNSSYMVIDTWNDASNINNVFFTKAFKSNLLPALQTRKTKLPKRFTHEFRVKSPMLQANEVVCLLGSTTHLKNWNTADPILMTASNNWFVCRVEMDPNEWPASYKYGIYNTSEKKVVGFEDGENRLLRDWELENDITILHDGFVNTPPFLWRGAGVNIPVFSLRSKKSFGAGEFTDLRLLIDWCRQTGIEMIQLLPINDTSAQNNWKDSYPYAAISAFALHPLYINLEKVAGKAQAGLIKKLRKKQKQLNDLPVMDYEQVMKFKRSMMRELYGLQKDELKEDLAFFEFFEINRHWLVPYAAFCYLKEKYKTPDFLTWKKYARYDESAIQKLAAPTQKHYDKIAIYYFEQYHLHRQLHDIVLYARKNNVTLKGDLPIGIYRYSCDAWVNPSLYNLEQQAGAPPDDFASEGQNWGFPTYNWDKMKANHFRWWRSRFDRLGTYFDVFRVDHILGFFRIWSIPIEQVEGVMGRFVPAIPVDIAEFGQNRIYFDHKRYCDPYITDQVLEQVFGDDAPLIADEFLTANGDDTYALREHVDTQRKALTYLRETGLMQFKKGLFSLISNVILFEEPDSAGSKFHFRIDIHKTLSYQHLDGYTQSQLQWLYNNYFFERQDHFWRKEALEKLPRLKRSTRMLVCGEDLGMVPDCVPQVMHQLGILGLNVERMPKIHSAGFFHPRDASYLSIVQPSTHDMSTLRQWWTEDRGRIQRFYNQMLGREGEAPAQCEPWIVRDIIVQHLYSPAMWSIFLLQDLLAMSGKLRTDNPADERINDPADANHYWRYRMHIGLEELLKANDFNAELKTLLQESGRQHKN